jgi:hypothetical protein
LRFHIPSLSELEKEGAETLEQAGPRLARMIRNWITLMLGIPSGPTEEPTVQAPKA